VISLTRRQKALAAQSKLTIYPEQEHTDQAEDKYNTSQGEDHGEHRNRL
jgi:hypothetical protein